MVKRTLQLLYPKKVDNKREVTSSMIDEIVRNSSDKFRYPVSIGHAAAVGGMFVKDDTPAAGRGMNLRKDVEGTLIGDFEFQPDIEEAFKSHKYPGWSVGIQPTPEGFVMDHLALLGSRGAAFKDLQEVEGCNFSVTDRGEQSAVIQCFSADNEKTLWLLQSTPKPPRQVDIPVASPPRGENPMSDEKLKMELAAKIAEIETFRVEKEALQTQLAETLKLESERRIIQFSSCKSALVKVAQDKGVTAPLREKLEKALKPYGELFASGGVGVELFEVITEMFSELNPKVVPGDNDDDDGEDDFIPQTNFSSKQATDSAFE